MTYLSGFHAILEALRARGGPHDPGSRTARILVARSDRKQGPRVRDIVESAGRTGIPVITVDAAELDRLAPDHRGVALEMAADERPSNIEARLEDFLAEPRDDALVVLLDHIEDPQNFGAIIRSADAFGADLLITGARRSAPLSEAAIRASAGAAAWVPIATVNNLGDAVRRLKGAGFWVYAADMGGARADQADLPRKCALVLGNEGAGVSRLVADLCDGAVSIPMSGHVDSLNVSAAAAVLMYEFRRRHP